MTISGRRCDAICRYGGWHAPEDVTHARRERHAAARAGAAHDGKPLSQWVEQAILNEAGRTDVRLIEEWERALCEEDRATLAAFAELDHATDLES